MTTMVETAHRQLLRDRRADALRVLRDATERIEAEAGTNPVLQEATLEAVAALTEATERLSTWCVNLFGQDAPAVDETCTCYRCTFDEVDPFQEVTL